MRMGAWGRAGAGVTVALAMMGCGDGTGPASGPGPGDLEIEVDTDDGGVPGSGDLIVETLNVEPFDSVVLIGEGDVVISHGDTVSATVEVDDNLLEYLEFDVVDATLRIRTRMNVDIDPSTTPSYRLTVPELVEVELLGAGTITTEGWATDAFVISMRGVGDIVVDDLAAETVSVDLGGVGSVQVSGTVATQTVTMAGVTEYLAEDLASRVADITCGDAGRAVLRVSDSLAARVTGTGAVSFYGDPTVSGDTEGVTRLGAG